MYAVVNTEDSRGTGSEMLHSHQLLRYNARESERLRYNYENIEVCHLGSARSRERMDKHRQIMASNYLLTKRTLPIGLITTIVHEIGMLLGGIACADLSLMVSNAMGGGT